MRHKNLELAHIPRIKLIFYYSEALPLTFMIPVQKSGPLWVWYELL